MEHGPRARSFYKTLFHLDTTLASRFLSLFLSSPFVALSKAYPDCFQSSSLFSKAFNDEHIRSFRVHKTLSPKPNQTAKMKFTAASVLAFAAGALANASFETSATAEVVYTTEVVTAITTYCPEPTEIDLGTTTITVTEATTLTIEDCPCTIKVPVTTVSDVFCSACPPSSFTTSYGSVFPTPAEPEPTNEPEPEPEPTTAEPPVVTAGALSGGALALGLAAVLL
jgi:hypothetical protein